MMVRCGYEWTGHPVTADGKFIPYTARRATRRPLVEVEVADSAPYEIASAGW